MEAPDTEMLPISLSIGENGTLREYEDDIVFDFCWDPDIKSVNRNKFIYQHLNRKPAISCP